MPKYPHQFLSETNGLAAVVAAGLVVLLFNSYRMGKLRKKAAILLGTAILFAAIALTVLR